MSLPDRPVLDAHDIASIVHELRGMVRSVVLCADMLAERGAADELVARIQERGRRMDEALLALHALGRASQQERDTRAIDPLEAAMVAWARSSMPPGFTLNAPATLPAVVACPDALAGVLESVFRNSWAHSDSSQGVVELEARQHDGRVTLAVKDDGPGLSEAMEGRLARPLQTTRGDRGHTGMGLAMARVTMSCMGGHLRVASVGGRGTCVELELGAAVS